MHNCRFCGEPGATYPSVVEGYLCNNAVACLERFARSGGFEAMDDECEEDDFESD